jgi:hypothetical protein
MATQFMIKHPLRESLSDDDLNRLEEVIRGNLPESDATPAEMDAAIDIMFDSFAIKTMTHFGVLTLQ